MKKKKTINRKVKQLPRKNKFQRRQKSPPRVDAIIDNQIDINQENKGNPPIESGKKKINGWWIGGAGLILTVVGIIASIISPELRKIIGLEKSVTSLPFTTTIPLSISTTYQIDTITLPNIIPSITPTFTPKNKLELVDDLFQCINRFTDITSGDNCWDYLSKAAKQDFIESSGSKDKYLLHNKEIRYRYNLYDCLENKKGEYYVGMKYAIYKKDDLQYFGKPIQNVSFLMIYVIYEEQSWKYWLGSNSTESEIETNCTYLQPYSRW